MGMIPANLSSLAAVALSTAIFYVLAIVALRIAGRRTLTEMSAFDWVVTVAVGSMIATTALNDSVTVAEGAVGLGALLGMQTLFAMVRRRFRWAQRIVDFAPVVVISDGRVSGDALGQLQMTREDLMEKLRSQGQLHLDGIRYGIIEPTGDLTVIPKGAPLDTGMETGLGEALRSDRAKES